MTDNEEQLSKMLPCYTYDENRKPKRLGLVNVYNFSDEYKSGGAAGGFSLVDPKNKLSLIYIQQIHGWEVRLQEEMRNVLYSCLD